MSRLQPLEVDDVEQQASKSGLVERLLQRLSGSATYSQLDTSDVHTARLSEDRWSPEEDAGLWSKLTYSYASGLDTTSLCTNTICGIWRTSTRQLL